MPSQSESTVSASGPQRKGFHVTHTRAIAPQPADTQSGPSSDTGSPTTSTSASPQAREPTSTDMSAELSPSGSPVPTQPRGINIPLITPRYQHKERANRAMQVTDSAPVQQNPTQALRQHTTENMSVRSGPAQYDQTVHFHTYELYRHGKRQIHSRSVGYSSDGDLVMTRADYSESSDNNMSFVRKATIISEPTVLNPRARRPLTDSELASRHPLRINRPRFKKYPGLYAPRNRRVRNRLINDFFAAGEAKAILDKARERAEGGIDDSAPTLKPSFSDLPPAVLRAFDLKDDEQVREMERLGIDCTGNGSHRSVHAPKNPDSAEGRFQSLNTRLRGELQHALNSEFLTRQIEDLEACFVEFIKKNGDDNAIVFHFRDGYGRLVCHGVSAYYRLNSESTFAADGATKLTYVTFPLSKDPTTPHTLPHSPLIVLLRGKRSHLPPRHILSVNNTPTLTPQQEPEQLPLDAMTPLDLNGGGMFPSEKQALSRLHNSTALLIPKGEVAGAVMPTYAPQLSVNLAEYQDTKDGVGGGPTGNNDGDTGEAMTATQKKKLKKAAKQAADQQH